ncbi:uncharacterized protein [Dysidea avara]|uniref:uncharacterized protein n=1 Tax=Dysidea avara TaxID=196820 RepID=UPI00332F5AA8
MNVLWWIRGRSKDFKPFVSNRVGEIQMSTYPAQWKLVSKKLNPADYLTRGVKLLQLAELDVWWNGPHFLHNDEKVWPKYVIEQNPVYTTEEVKRSVLVSIWLKMILGDCHQKGIQIGINMSETRSDRLLDEELHIEEITDATKQILKVMQQSMFFEEYVALTKGKKLPSKSKLLSLCPKLDEDGIMRADGQLKYAEFLPYDV